MSGTTYTVSEPKNPRPGFGSKGGNHSDRILDFVRGDLELSCNVLQLSVLKMVEGFLKNRYCQRIFRIQITGLNQKALAHITGSNADADQISEPRQGPLQTLSTSTARESANSSTVTSR